MARTILEWTISRATIDQADLMASDDPALVARVRRAAALVRTGASATRVREALGPLTFEWCWSNCDSDPSEVFEDPTDFTLELDAGNSNVDFEPTREEMIVSIGVRFALDVRAGLDPESLDQWLERESAHACGFASGGWCYAGDEGSSVTVVAST